FFFSSRRRHTRFDCDWSSDVCSSDLVPGISKFVLSTGRCVSHDWIPPPAGRPLMSRPAGPREMWISTHGDSLNSWYVRTGPAAQIGRASCRERVEVWVVAD